MPADSETIKTLRRFYKDRLAIPDTVEMQAEIMGASDRSTVIALAAFLDAALEWLIASNMRPQATVAEFDETFGINGPLGSFSARIKIAYMLKLIEEPLRNQLEVIREMRNACAHSKRPISFENPELANVGKRILHPKGSFRIQGDTPQEIKSAFTAECLFLHGVLLWGRDKAIEEVRISYRKAGKASPL